MADNNLQASFRKLMRYAQNLAEYNKAIEDGIIDENVFVIVLDEKVAKFKGQTFDWSESVEVDLSSLATKDELIEVEEVAAAAFNDLKGIIDNIPSVEVDAELSADSENAIQNKAVATELANKADVSALEESKEEIMGVIEAVALDAGEMIAAANLSINDLYEKKQDKLVSGTNIKTINGESILGEGNIVVNVDTSNLATKEELASLQNEIIANEEVVAAAFNDLNERINNIPSGGGESNITVDTEMSDTSTNAVQNRVIKEYVDNAVTSAITTTLNTAV